MQSHITLIIDSRSEIPCPFQHSLTNALCQEARVRRPGGEAGTAVGHLLFVVGSVPGAGGVPPQAPPPVRREPQLPRPRQGMLRRHPGARALQAVR